MQVHNCGSASPRRTECDSGWSRTDALGKRQPTTGTEAPLGLSRREGPTYRTRHLKLTMPPSPTFIGAMTSQRRVSDSPSFGCVAKFASSEQS